MLKFKNYQRGIESLAGTPLQIAIKKCLVDVTYPSYDTIRLHQATPLLSTFFASSTYPLLENTEAFYAGYTFNGNLLFDDTGTYWYGMILCIPSGHTFISAIRENPKDISIHINSFGKDGEALLENGGTYDKIFEDGQELTTLLSTYLVNITKIKCDDKREIMGRLWLALAFDKGLQSLPKYLSSSDIESSISKTMHPITSCLSDSLGLAPAEIVRALPYIFGTDSERALKCYPYLWKNC